MADLPIYLWRARDALLEQARLLANELGVEYAVLRFVDDGSTPPAPWQQHPIYCTYLMDLPTRGRVMGKFQFTISQPYSQVAQKGL